MGMPPNQRDTPKYLIESILAVLRCRAPNDCATLKARLCVNSTRPNALSTRWFSPHPGGGRLTQTPTEISTPVDTSDTRNSTRYFPTAFAQPARHTREATRYMTRYITPALTVYPNPQSAAKAHRPMLCAIAQSLAHRHDAFLGVLLAWLLLGTISLVMLTAPAHAAPQVGKLSPATAFLNTALGQLHQASTTTDCATALTYTQIALEDDPSNPMGLYLAGYCAFQQAESIPAPENQTAIQQAEEAFTRLKTHHPEMLVSYYRLGKLALMRGDIAQAKAAYEEGLSVDPKQGLLHFNYANVLDEEKRYTEALKHYQLATRLAPEHAFTWNNLGLLHEKLNQPEKAIAAYQKALRLAPGYSFAALNYGNLLITQSRFHEALAVYQRVLAADKQNPWPHFYIGNIYLHWGQHQRAIAAYESMIGQQPDYTPTYYLLALALAHQGDWDLSLAYCMKYLAKDPKGPFAERASQLLQDGRYRQAAAQQDPRP